MYSKKSSGRFGTAGVKPYPCNHIQPIQEQPILQLNEQPVEAVSICRQQVTRKKKLKFQRE
jgi:hypothetical protein